MKPRRVVLAFGVAALAALPAACSLLYGDYGNDFQGKDASAKDGIAADGPDADVSAEASTVLVAEDASITTVAVTTSAVFYSIGGQLLSVLLDGGGRSAVWTGDGGALAVVNALTSDGVSNLAWSYGDSQNNTIFLAAASAPGMPARIAHGQAYGGALAADDASVVWNTTQETPDANGNPILEIYDWHPVGGPMPIVFKASPRLDAGSRPTAFGALAVALSPASVYSFIANAGVVRFAREDRTQQCEAHIGIPNHYIALAAGPTDLYVVANPTKSGYGTLTRYEVGADGGCPASDEGTPLETDDVVLVAADATGVYWVTTKGDVERELAGKGDAAHELGTMVTSPAAMAIDDTYVYVAAGTDISRFPKHPVDTDP